MNSMTLGVAVAAVATATMALAAPAAAHADPQPAGPPPTGPLSTHALSTHALPTDPSAFHFSDCPTLPAGLDPTGWQCEVHLATGDITVGRVSLRDLPLRLVHAEGPLPDGDYGQIFGTLQSPPVAVPEGGAKGNAKNGNAKNGNAKNGNAKNENAKNENAKGHGMTVQLRYGGYADLIGNGPDPGGLYLTLAVRGPGLGTGCTIGTLTGPIRTHAARVGDTTTIPTDPPIRAFTLQDNAFTVPAATNCHGHERQVDERFGLPSTGGNTMTLHAEYTYQPY